MSLSNFFHLSIFYNKVQIFYSSFHLIHANANNLTCINVLINGFLWGLTHGIIYHALIVFKSRPNGTKEEA